jgi:Tfp pilus assembly protein PilV
MKPAQRKTKYENCFTLVEVLVASMLLTVAMVPILQALAASHTLSRRVEYKTQSLVYAKARLDWIKAESIYSFDNDFTEDSTLIEGRYLVTVADEDLSPVNSDLRQITVYVGYDGNNNANLEDGEVEVGLRTLIARRWN